MKRTTTAFVIATLACLVCLPGLSLADQPSILAKVGEKSITKDEVYNAAAAKLAEIRQAEYEALNNALNEMVDRMLLTAEAERLGLSLDEYFKKHIEEKVTAPSDEEVNSFYERYKSRLRGQTLEAARPQIVDRLKQVAAQGIYKKIMTDLKAKTKVSLFLEPPRTKVGLGDFPVWGSESAKVTIVEFSDYQCPYCSRAETQAIAQIKDKYKGKVRIAFRNYPLPFHNNAQKAHEAAACAGDQGKFWEMHEKLFANQNALGVEQLKAYAVELALDSEKFNSCLDSGKFADAIAKDAKEGAALGVQGTPAFFINGRFLSGAQPFSAFAAIIDEELARSGS